MAGEMLGPILLSIHNLTYYQRLLAGAGRRLSEDRFEEYGSEKMEEWGLNSQRRHSGTLRGTVEYLADDFAAPLEDFKEYMDPSEGA